PFSVVDEGRVHPACIYTPPHPISTGPQGAGNPPGGTPAEKRKKSFPPPLSQIEDRIRACREELVALKRLHRLALAAQAAKEASSRRPTQDREEGHHAK